MLPGRHFLPVGGGVGAAATAGRGGASLLSGALLEGATGSTPAPPAATPTAAPAAPQPAPQPAPPPVKPVTVALLSDTHIQAANSDVAKLVNPKLERALADLQALKPDLWLNNGDVTEDGILAQYGAFKDLISKAIPVDQLLVTTGNHDFYDFAIDDAASLRRFREVFGLPQHYTSKVVDGVHLVLLADEMRKGAPKTGLPDWAWITPEQLRWFEQVLADHRDRFTAVFLHQPLQNTVAGTTGTSPFGGTGQAQELRDILGRNPQVKLWFSGHTHRRVDLENQVSKQGHTTFVALGSTAYLLGAPPGGGSGGGKDYTASQSRVMEIYPDRVVIRARDHVAKQWLDNLTVTVARV